MTTSQETGDKLPSFFFSNRVEELFFFLKEVLFLRLAGTSPFTRRIVVVPSDAMKRWLMLRLAKEIPSHIAMGIEWLLLDQAITTLGVTPRRPLPSLLQLSVAIEKELRHQIESSCNTIWKPLLDYLGVAPGAGRLPRRAEKRISALSLPLAQAFHEYGIYGKRLIDSWEADSHWQAALWHSLFGKGGPYAYPAEHLTAPLPSTQLHDVQVHVFALSFLSTLHHHFLQRLSPHCFVAYYVLSPCEMFWGDNRSDKERRRLDRWWARRGAHARERETLEEYLRDTNPLLANLGKVGRELFSLVEASEGNSYEAYASPLEEAPPCLLYYLQDDLLSLKNPSLEPPIELFGNDDSIQIHAAPSKRRESEALYNAIVRLIEKHHSSSSPLSPRDIVVMAPNIVEYEPYIRAIFEGADSVLACQFTDLSLAQPGSVIQGLERLVSLAHSRWEPSSVMALLSHPAVARRHALLPGDLDTLHRWIEQTEIRWALSPLHRDEILLRDLCRRGVDSEAYAGTWQHGIERLIGAMTRSLSGDEEPVAIDFSDAELLNKLLELLRSLRDDLSPLVDNTRLPLHLWGEYLMDLVDSYLLADLSAQWEADSLHQLTTFIKKLKSADRYDTADSWSFTSVLPRLQEFFTREDGVYRDAYLNSVRFCSMLPMRAVPARVLCLIGMDEDSYPRKMSSRSFNLLQGSALSDFCPTRGDFDRYLFLEALLSARDHLLLFYTCIDSTDHKEESPSPVITELCQYLDRAYRVDGTLPSRACLVRHPFSPFDAALFSPDATLCRSYLESHYAAAKSAYQGAKRPAPPLIAIHLPREERPKLSYELSMTLAQLTRAIKSPVQLYFQERLSMRLLREEEAPSAEGEFTVTPLDRWKIRRQASIHDKGVVSEAWQAKGRWGGDSFGTLAKQKTLTEAAGVRENLQRWGIDSNDIFSINLSHGCSSPRQVGTHRWQYPELVFPFEGGSIRLSGELPLATTQGLLIPDKGEAHHLFRAWPSHLTALFLSDNGALVGGDLLFAESGKRKSRFAEAPITYLERYISYYLSCCYDCSLLSDRVLHKFLKDPTGDDLFSSHDEGDESLHWLQARQKLPTSQEIQERWEGVATAAFGDLHRHWIGGKKGAKDGAL